MINDSFKEEDLLEPFDVEATLKETRVKKYKSYRVRIKKDYNELEKGNAEKDYLNSFEKSIKKINPKLIINQNDPKQMFMDIVVNETSAHGYLDKAKTTLNKIESKKLQDIIFQSSNYEDKFQSDPTFDKEGNLSLDWFKNDSNFTTLKRLQQWNNFMINNKHNIENILKEKSYVFKTSISKSQTESIVNSILPKSIEKKAVYKNVKLKKIFYILFFCFSLIILLIFIFLILLLV